MASKTFSEQIADLKATREAKTTAMRECAQKSVDESRSMNTAEAEEFETLKGEIKRLDDDIGRLTVMVSMDQASAKPTEPAVSKSAASTALAPVQIKNTQKLEPGIAFARIARVKALAFTGQAGIRDEVQIAKAIYPGDDTLVQSLQTKAAVDAANTLNTGWAGNLVIEGGGPFADFVEYLRPRGLLGQISSRLRRLPFDVPVLIQGSGGTAKWVKEGFAKPLTEWTYTRANMKPLKVAAIAAATKEMLMRASMAADGLIRDELARSVNARIDSTLIDPAAAAVTDESPASLLNGVTPVVLSGGSTADDVRCDVATLMKVFSTNNQSLRGAFWIMPESVAISLSLMQNPLGQSEFPGINFEGGTFFNMPVFISNYVGEDSDGAIIALIKGDEIFLGDEGGIQMSMSDQASLQMDNSPTQNSVGTPVATSVVSMWQTNSVAFLVERFINWQRRRAESVAWGRVAWDACA